MTAHFSTIAPAPVSADQARYIVRRLAATAGARVIAEEGHAIALIVAPRPSGSFETLARVTGAAVAAALSKGWLIRDPRDGFTCYTLTDAGQLRAAAAPRQPRIAPQTLAPDLIGAAHRLQIDYEAALAAGVEIDLDRIAQGAAPAARPGTNAHDCETALASLRDPDLIGIAAASCCLCEGIEAVERRLSLPARSARRILSIALRLLAMHYAGQSPALIG